MPPPPGAREGSRDCPIHPTQLLANCTRTTGNAPRTSTYFLGAYSILLASFSRWGGGVLKNARRLSLLLPLGAAGLLLLSRSALLL